MPRLNRDFHVFAELCVSRKNNKTPPETKQFLNDESDHFLVYYFIAPLFYILIAHAGFDILDG